ncbi:hypothetical protein GWI33_016773 [Rhynchophorus ferrugineus]|uniref:Uncharacterized protein n=1 Tax=Rhynchophorus ferrugineus TaxID=354439 RepID=A0A834IAH7_RHYFE|nr:hypothetical protein GWI33_016773 [Rhynchophorus ferrugineus]
MKGPRYIHPERSACIRPRFSCSIDPATTIPPRPIIPPDNSPDGTGIVSTLAHRCRDGLRPATYRCWLPQWTDAFLGFYRNPRTTPFQLEWSLLHEACASLPTVIGWRQVTEFWLFPVSNYFSTLLLMQLKLLDLINNHLLFIGLEGNYVE